MIAWLREIGGEAVAKEAGNEREAIATALRVAEVPEPLAEKIMALHDLAVIAADLQGFDRAASLAIACAQSKRGKY